MIKKSIIIKVNDLNLSQRVDLQNQYDDMTEKEAKEFCEWQNLNNEDDNYARIIETDKINANGHYIEDEENVYLQIAEII